MTPPPMMTARRLRGPDAPSPMLVHNCRFEGNRMLMWSLAAVTGGGYPCRHARTKVRRAGRLCPRSEDEVHVRPLDRREPRARPVRRAHAGGAEAAPDLRRA